MKDLQKLMDDIREWSDATFGEENRTIPILYHLIKEVPEAIQACKEYPDSPLFAQCEIADCFMLILDAANHIGMKAPDLMVITEKKLAVNKKRKWGKPDENGVIEHIKEEGITGVTGVTGVTDQIHPKYHEAMKKFFAKISKDTEGMNTYEYFNYVNNLLK